MKKAKVAAIIFATGLLILLLFFLLVPIDKHRLSPDEKQNVDLNRLQIYLCIYKRTCKEFPATLDGMGNAMCDACITDKAGCTPKDKCGIPCSNAAREASKLVQAATWAQPVNLRVNGQSARLEAGSFRPDGEQIIREFTCE